ncbi:DUF4435 domain-containing protein [Bernardetia sp. OM2101]|uniref:DUF4435 domain-containing protein n=1 Tax=Bernardetia sp. OM2101 TaxID=3344876 RepID=UPI0035D0F83E
MDISLPKNGSSKNEIYSINSDIVIIGANGSGKSRFGNCIEQINKNVYRIAARKHLDVPSSSILSSFDGGEKVLKQRLQQGGVSSMQNASEMVIQLLFAEQSSHNQLYVDASRSSNNKVEITESNIDMLEDIWKQLIPNRKISLKDLKVKVETNTGIAYNINEMSDGEKVMLYLIGQCLLVPDNSILIIDEPEIHINKSILAYLWNQIEAKKPNCLFIYITHDLDFALSRNNSQKIWVKSYNKNSTNNIQIWDWEFLNQTDNIPEELTLKLLGNRKPILFVEGVKNKSLDLKIYEAIYTDYTVIARDGCDKVIEATKTFKDNPSLHFNKVFGIVDRDYRSDDEVESLKNNGIYTLDLAEIENLFCIIELIEIIADNQGKDKNEVLEQITDFVIKKLEGNLEEQVSKRTASEIGYRLNTLSNQKIQGKENMKNEFDKVTRNLSNELDEIYKKNQTLYSNIIENRDYTKALKFYGSL